MATEMTDEIKAIMVLPFSGLQRDWDEWSEKYQGIAAERGYLQVMLGNELVLSDLLDIEQKVLNKCFIPDEYETSDDEAKTEGIQRSSTCYYQVGPPTCISGKDSESSKRIICQVLGSTQG